MSAYYSILMKLKPRPFRVAVSKGEVHQDLTQITEIPKIAEENINEVEMLPVKQNYSYVRIKYDNMANEYLYEVIEPKLSERREGRALAAEGDAHRIRGAHDRGEGLGEGEVPQADSRRPDEASSASASTHAPRRR